MASQNEYIRIAAYAHKNRPESSNAKVIFVRGGRLPSGMYATDDKKAYFMSEKTYNLIPLLFEANVTDYKKLGTIIRANNIDLQDDEMTYRFFLVSTTKREGYMYAKGYRTKKEAEDILRKYYLTDMTLTNQKVVTTPNKMTLQQFRGGNRQ